MKRLCFVCVILMLLFSITLFGFAMNVFLEISCAIAEDRPRTFLVKLEHLELVDKLWKKGDLTIQLNMNLFLSQADRAMKRGPYSVTQKKYKHPSGDQHDFLAYGAYYWPNPDTQNGLPWIRRDGHYNPESAIDWNLLGPMASDVEDLAFAYYFTGNEKYAKQAALLLRTWFINGETRMNPNMNYGKVIPGLREGGFAVAGFGMVIRKVYDGAGLLESSSSWTDFDKEALQQWTKNFILWMQNSPYGKKELKTKNNHATFYYSIWMLMSMYINDYTGANKALNDYLKKRLPIQFLPDGTQPSEMKRKNNYRYHLINLGAAFDIAQMADHLREIDVWSYTTDQGAGLKKSTEFLVPYLVEQKKWNYFKREVFKVPSHKRWILLRRAAVGFNDWTFEEAAKMIESETDPFTQLCYPERAISMKSDNN